MHSTTWISLTVSKEVQEKADLSSFFSCQSGGGRYPYTSPGEPKYLMKYLKEMCERFDKHCFQFREKHIYCSNFSATVQVSSFWWYLFLTYTPYKTNWSLDKEVLRCVKKKWDGWISAKSKETFLSQTHSSGYLTAEEANRWVFEICFSSFFVAFWRQNKKKLHLCNIISIERWRHFV